MKQIKDPIYGYIDLEDFCFPLIDTAEFQRLRNIVQTGYQALYPSALHNRFVHSIGVYHLGKKAFDCFRKNVMERKYEEYIDIPWDKYRKTFVLACLLHDIGHSPFSHTGEEYYNRSTDFKEELKKCFPNSFDFHEDIKTDTGKPHEAMSAIVGLKLLSENFEDIDKELFVRSIIGVKYKADDKLLENTIIGMLNGSLIDVDKLDYLIRDSYVTGFNTMALDVDRLFAGYIISEYTDASSAVKRIPAFKRGSLSVIENVTFANDLERHWIQNNPTILYDVKLIQLAIENYDNYMVNIYKDKLGDEKSIFSKTAISSTGYIEKGINLSLLCDDDIICFLKNHYRENVVSKQFFDREQRLKPIWKSEIEFKNLEHELIGNSVARSFKNTLRAIHENTFYINDEKRNQAIEDLAHLQQTINCTSIEEVKEVAKKSLPSQQDIVKVFNIFYDFAKINNLNNDFAFIFVTKHYESNYAKLMNEEIYIEFNRDRVIQLRDALSVEAIDASDEEKTGYYYIYTSKHNIDVLKSKEIDIASELLLFISQNWNKK
mgnify:CR=1 FL=1